jgi:hypothetical protein
MSYVGERVWQYNLPKNWPEQAERILRLLRDAPAATTTSSATISPFWTADCIWWISDGRSKPARRSHRPGRQASAGSTGFGIHRFDDRHAIHAALESAERGLIDRSIVMAG